MGKLALVASVLVGFVLVGCDTSETTGINEDSFNGALTDNMDMPEPSKPLTASELASVCKAGIAETFGQPIAIMKIVSNEAGIVRVRYNRPSDNKRWTNDCRVEGNRLIWRSVDAFPGDGPGIWRTRPADEVVTFKVSGNEVVLETTYPDNEPVTATYNLS